MVSGCPSLASLSEAGILRGSAQHTPFCAPAVLKNNKPRYRQALSLLKCLNLCRSRKTNLNAEPAGGLKTLYAV